MYCPVSPLQQPVLIYNYVFNLEHNFVLAHTRCPTPNQSLLVLYEEVRKQNQSTYLVIEAT